MRPDFSISLFTAALFMRLHAAQTVASYRVSQVEGELIVVWRQHIPLPQQDDELELDGLRYRLVAQLWPETGVMGAVLRFRQLETASYAEQSSAAS